MPWELVLLGVCYVGASRTAIAFRRGRPSPWRDRMVSIVYRRAGMPRVWRNMPLYMPVTLGMLIPVVVGFGLLAVTRTDVVAWPHWARSVAVWGLFGFAFLTLGFSLILAFRPPRWLIPGWLRDLDQEDGYIPPDADWYDGFWLIVGMLFLAASAATVLVAYLGATGTRGL